MIETKDLMHCHYNTNIECAVYHGDIHEPMETRTWEVRPRAREESASPIWMAVLAMNAVNKANIYYVFVLN